MHTALSTVSRTLRPAVTTYSNAGGRRLVAAMAAPTTIYVKGFPDTGVLGDCPFCHKVLLALETKNVEYSKEFIDLANKPAWFLEMTEAGSVPVVKAGDKLITDSSDAMKWLEAEFPEPSMSEAETAEVGSAVFGAFVQYLKASGEAEAEKKAALEAELSALNEYLTGMKGPFVGGKTLNATDANLAPKLYHLSTVLAHFKGFSLEPSFSAVAAYLAAVSATAAWKNCYYAPEIVLAGWQKKLDASK